MSKLSGADLLARLNSMSETYQYGRFKSLPEISPEASAILAGVRVTVVDDLPDVLMNVGADLLVATENNVSLILHLSQSAETLVDEIVTTSPDLILMDGALRRGVKGADLLRTLSERLPNTCLVGHSGDDELNKEMLRVGAFGFVSKTGGDVQVDRIARIYERFKDERRKDNARGELSDVCLGGNLPEKDLEVLAAFSMLLQSYLLTHASHSQRLEMGVPDGLLDSDVLENAKESYKSSSWWLAPFEGVNLEQTRLYTTGECPSLKQFIEELRNGSELSLNWERADALNREILAALERD
jgi:DNA-binding NarL/FixJ family response regulator